ncbi:MAG: DUF378 domain-containing protein [Chloroflexota bacterium]
MRLNVLDWIAFILTIIGALNWGLVGLFNLNVVTLLFSGVPILVTIVYLLVGLAGLYMVYFLATKSSPTTARA